MDPCGSNIGDQDPPVVLTPVQPVEPESDTKNGIIEWSELGFNNNCASKATTPAPLPPKK